MHINIEMRKRIQICSWDFYFAFQQRYHTRPKTQKQHKSNEMFEMHMANVVMNIIHWMLFQKPIKKNHLVYIEIETTIFSVCLSPSICTSFPLLYLSQWLLNGRVLIYGKLDHSSIGACRCLIPSRFSFHNHMIKPTNNNIRSRNLLTIKRDFTSISFICLFFFSFFLMCSFHFDRIWFQFVLAFDDFFFIFISLNKRQCIMFMSI